MKDVWKMTTDEYIKSTYKHYLVRFYVNMRIRDEVVLAKDKEEARWVITHRYPERGDFVQIKEVTA